MISFGSPDSKFAQGMESFADAVWLTILMIITSIPIITIGASITAAHETARRIERGEAHTTSIYFKSFKNNFVKSTIIWIILLPILLAIVGSWIFLQLTPLLIIKFAISILWVLVAQWVFALQARPENSVGRTLIKSPISSVSYIATTFMMVLLDFVFFARVYLSLKYFLQGLPLLILLGWGSLIMLHTPLLERVFAKYVKTSGKQSVN